MQQGRMRGELGPKRTKRSAGDPQVIDPGLSVSLDVIRFLAALVVCVGHASGKWLTGGMFWQLGIFLHAAVMVFFVLSGYVVAATTRPASGGVSYTAARMSRLLSVVIPALLVTALLDSLGMWINADFYLVTAQEATNGGTDVTTTPVWRYIINLLHIQEFWLLNGPRAPGTNAPFWSLSFEASYYALFGMLMFLRPQWAWLGITFLLLAAGPRIAILAPIWFAGVLLWKWRPRISVPLGAAALTIGVAMLIGFALLKPWIISIDESLPYRRLFADYWAGMFTALIIAGIGALSHLVTVSERVVARIRSVADHTFELYLVHIPTVYFIAAVTPTASDDPARLFQVYGAIFIVTVITHRMGRGLRPVLRKSIKQIFAGKSVPSTLG